MWGFPTVANSTDRSINEEGTTEFVSDKHINTDKSKQVTATYKSRASFSSDIET